MDGSDQGPWCPGSRLELAAEALKRYGQDPLYRVLFERTGQLFAEQLREDLRDSDIGIGGDGRGCSFRFCIVQIGSDGLQTGDANRSEATSASSQTDFLRPSLLSL